MNVLMIGPARNVHGGISGVVNNLYEAGLDKKVNINYIGTMEEGSKLHKLAVAIKAYIAFRIQLKGADIVHVNMASDSSFYRKALFVRAAHRAKKPIIIHQHGGDFSTFYEGLSSKKQDYIKKILNMASEFLVLSPAYEEFFKELVTSCNIKITPDTIKVPSRENDSTKDRHSILFLGRVCKAKGVSELLSAIKALETEFPDIHLYIGGIFEDLEYKSIIDSMKNRVTYLGWLEGEAKRQYLRKTDIFVLPSYFEGQSVAILEAMANGCAVVGSNVGGIPMMIEDSVTGVLVEPKNAESLVNGLRRLLGDDDFKDEVRRKAYSRVLEDFSIDNTISELVNIYSGVSIND